MTILEVYQYTVSIGIHGRIGSLHAPRGFWWKYRIHRWEDRKAGDEQNPNGLGNPILKLPFLPSSWFHERCVCISNRIVTFQIPPFSIIFQIMGERVGNWNGISCSNFQPKRTNGWMVSLKCLSICPWIPTSGWCPPTWSQRIIRCFFFFICLGEEGHYYYYRTLREIYCVFF